MATAEIEFAIRAAERVVPHLRDTPPSQWPAWLKAEMFDDSKMDESPCPRVAPRVGPEYQIRHVMYAIAKPPRNY